MDAWPKPAQADSFSWGPSKGSKTTVNPCLGANLNEVLCERQSSRDRAAGGRQGEERREGLMAPSPWCLAQQSPRLEPQPS